MKRLSWLFMLCILTQTRALWAIPTEINYQGTLRGKNGTPLSGQQTLKFTVTNIDAGVTYSNPITVTPILNNGLFATKLNFQLKTGYTWENITPYIQVNVNGNDLGPPEKISATLYAVMSDSVVDNAITRPKVDTISFENAGPGFVPVGAIMMFASSCPAGWTRFTALDNAFPMGSVSYGGTGGSTTHNHSISMGGAHSHTTPKTCGVDKCGVSLGSSGAEYNPASSGWVPETPSMTTSQAGDHDHGGFSGTSGALPPYVTVVYCQKQ